MDLEIFACDDFRAGVASGDNIQSHRFWKPTAIDPEDTLVITEPGFAEGNRKSNPRVTHIGEPGCKLGSYDIEFGDSKRLLYNISRYV